MVVEVLNLIQAPLVVGLSIVGRIDRLVAWNTSLVVLASLMEFRGKDDKWWQSPALGTDGSDDYSPFPVTRLG